MENKPDNPHAANRRMEMAFLLNPLPSARSEESADDEVLAVITSDLKAGTVTVKKP